MARLGAFCFPGTGHLNPMTALARSLQLRGHEVVIFGIADTEARVRAAGIEFHGSAWKTIRPAPCRKLDEQLARLKGLAALRFTLERVRNSARMVLRDGPEAVRAANVEALLVDEADFAGNVADYLGLPWISIALIPPLLQDDRFPPFWFGWAGGTGSAQPFAEPPCNSFAVADGSPYLQRSEPAAQRMGAEALPASRRMRCRRWRKSPSCLKRWSSNSPARSQRGFTIPGRSYTLISARRSSFPGSASMDARSFTHRWALFRTVRKPSSEPSRRPVRGSTHNY